MESEQEKAELNAGAIFPSWIVITLATLMCVCVGIVIWDFAVGGMSTWVFLVNALPLSGAAVILTFFARASIKFKRWFRESKEELATIKAENDRTEAAGQGRIAR
jgi:membrane protein YdbS with pleckstrin-like domain